MKALVGAMALSVLMAAGPVLATEGDCAPDPKEVQGFTDLCRRNQGGSEGGVVVYATNPEAAEVRGSLASSPNSSRKSSPTIPGCRPVRFT